MVYGIYYLYLYGIYNIQYLSIYIFYLYTALNGRNYIHVSNRKIPNRIFKLQACHLQQFINSVSSVPYRQFTSVSFYNNLESSDRSRATSDVLCYSA